MATRESPAISSNPTIKPVGATGRPLKILSEGSLTMEEIALLELYQRQDALSTQLWQHFLLANVAVISVIVLIQHFFGACNLPFADWMPTRYVMGFFVFIAWITFTYGGLSALQNVQDILLALAHQIEGDVGDKTDLFTRATRSKDGIMTFHLFVDIGVFGLCLSLLLYPSGRICN